MADLEQLPADEKLQVPGIQPLGETGSEDFIRCKSCGTNLPRIAMLCSNPICGRNPRVDPAPDGSVIDERPMLGPLAGDAELSSDPLASARSNVAGSVIITLPNHDSVEVKAGDRLILGRDSPREAVRRAFEVYEEVSRLHVRLVNDEQGPALIMLGDTGGQFGTFVQGKQLPNEKDQRFVLQHGDSIRLGARATCRIDLQ